jgi:hypothetical protein
MQRNTADQPVNGAIKSNIFQFHARIVGDIVNYELAELTIEPRAVIVRAELYRVKDPEGNETGH